MTLTPRQREVVALLHAGLSYRRAAKVLGISPRTVRVHAMHIAARLDGEETTLRRLLRHAPDLLRAA